MEFWYVDIVLLLIIIALFIVILLLNSRIRKLTNTTNANNIEALIHEYYEDINALKDENEELLERISKNQQWITKAFTKYDIKRYNPLEDMGGELSFVVTCLNANNSGFILNSIYGHNFSQVYIKPIENGFSNINLSYEEMESLKRAINNI